MTDQVAIGRLASLLEQARGVLCFTGAGISTGSNIPDYRGPKGVWQTRQPVYYQAFVSSHEARVEYWEYKLEAQAAFRAARPNPAHRALVEIERAGKLHLLVTQNIDGLHRAAGTSPERLVELHGTNAEATCLDCSARVAMAGCISEFEKTRIPPCCGACGGLMKPAVVMFGEGLDAETLRRAFAAAESADLVLALGSSLSVTPAADVPLRAARRGVPYVIVNQGATPHDSIAALKIDADVCEVLPPCVAATLASSV